MILQLFGGRAFSYSPREQFQEFKSKTANSNMTPQQFL